jgi:hypothetical protein
LLPPAQLAAKNKSFVPRPKGYRVSPGENPGGRPSVLEKDPKLQERIAECFLLGLTDEQTALDCNISVATVTRLRQGKFCKAVKRAELAREKIYRQKVWDGKNGWQGTAWFLERKYATQFAKPEILLAVNQQVSTGPTNVVVIGPERARILASRHEQLRAKSIALLDARQTSAGNGQGSAQQRPVASEPVAAELRGRESANPQPPWNMLRLPLRPRFNPSTTNTRFLKCVPHSTPKIPRWFSLCCLFSLALLGQIHAAQPDFGPNVKIFNASMPQSEIQATVDAIANQQIPNQFGTQRYALLFMPGTYGSADTPLNFQVGYYLIVQPNPLETFHAIQQERALEAIAEQQQIQTEIMQDQLYRQEQERQAAIYQQRQLELAAVEAELYRLQHPQNQVPFQPVPVKAHWENHNGFAYWVEPNGNWYLKGTHGP